MAQVTQLIQLMAKGDARAANELYEVVYQQLRRMAGRRMASERGNHTLEPTALVNEVYLRLAGANSNWENRKHFFGVASEAMRRILVEQARAKSRLKRGGQFERREWSESQVTDEPVSDDWIDLDEALADFEAQAPDKAELVKMHVFSGLTMPQCAQALGVSISTVERSWRFAKAWLKARMVENPKK